MLQITVPSTEMWDDSKEEFVYVEEQTLLFEHSLLSLSKWESKYCKPFLSKKEKTTAEVVDYIKFMTLTANVDPSVYDRLTEENLREIDTYINARQTATTFYDDKGSKGKNEVVTAELIYYWMFSFNIPMECEEWHLDRLITLIRVFNVKNAPPKKQSKSDIMRRNAALNAERRAKLNSKG